MLVNNALHVNKCTIICVKKAFRCQRMAVLTCQRLRPGSTSAPWRRCSATTPTQGPVQTRRHKMSALPKSHDPFVFRKPSLAQTSRQNLEILSKTDSTCPRVAKTPVQAPRSSRWRHKSVVFHPRKNGGHFVKACAEKKERRHRSNKTKSL